MVIQNNSSRYQSNWYAVYTKSRFEKKLNSLLERKRIKSFLPLSRTLRQHSDRKKWVEFPLLPSYVLVFITEKEHYEVLNTPGAVCFVAFNGRPTPIPEEQIEKLKKIVDNQVADIEVYHGNMEKGEVVKIMTGPLKGVEGEVVEFRGKQRLLLRFESLGYCIHAEIPTEEIVPIKKPAKAPHKTTPLI